MGQVGLDEVYKKRCGEGGYVLTVLSWLPVVSTCSIDGTTSFIRLRQSS